MRSTLTHEWSQIRSLFNDAFMSSFHFALASVGTDGAPQLTPIGSLLLDPYEPKGIYFEVFTSALRKNSEVNPKVAVLAVNSSRWFWIRSLWRGQFCKAPGIRLYGEAGVRRQATPTEIERWRKRVGPLRWLKGSKRLWGNLTHVREIRFTDYGPLSIGQMTPSFARGAS